MSIIDHSKHEIGFKLVYYGPGLSGKTSNLEWLYRRHATAQGARLTNLLTYGERTLYFSFLPSSLPKIRDHSCRFHLYTIPGSVLYDDSLRLLLRGVDSLVFVADSQAARLEVNLESLEGLERNLEVQGLSLADIPHIFQYNKRDLPELLPIEELRTELNAYDVEDFAAVAVSGQGIQETFDAIAQATIARSVRSARG